MVAAGVAGNSAHMMASAVLALARLVYAYRQRESMAETSVQLLQTVCTLLQHKAQEVVRAAIVFCKGRRAPPPAAAPTVRHLPPPPPSTLWLLLPGGALGLAAAPGAAAAAVARAAVAHLVLQQAPAPQDAGPHRPAS